MTGTFNHARANGPFLLLVLRILYRGFAFAQVTHMFTRALLLPQRAGKPRKQTQEQSSLLKMKAACSSVRESLSSGQAVELEVLSIENTFCPSPSAQSAESSRNPVGEATQEVRMAQNVQEEWWL
jgi:hypothetical protein